MADELHLNAVETAAVRDRLANLGIALAEASRGLDGTDPDDRYTLRPIQRARQSFNSVARAISPDQRLFSDDELGLDEADEEDESPPN